MAANHFGALPVVQKGALLGIVTESDLLRYFASLPEEEKSAADNQARPVARVKKG